MGLRATAKDWWQSVHNPPRARAAWRREMRTIGVLCLLLSSLVMASGVLGVVTGGELARGIGCVLVGTATVLLTTSWMIYRTGRRDR